MALLLKYYDKYIIWTIFLALVYKTWFSIDLIIILKPSPGATTVKLV